MAGPHFDYQIRESARAKYMSLRVTIERGLEVVVPRGFNRKLIPTFLQEKHAWVQSALSKVEQARERRTAEPIDNRPLEIAFPSIGKTWTIEYATKASRTVTLTDDRNGRLCICGPIDNTTAYHSVLQRWMHRQAHTALVPLLRQLSNETGIAFVRTAIRCQKSRWGSCSSSGTISLNQKLLFVEPDLVRYVLIHELCHMREMNHSRHFWKLVSQFYPNYRLARRRLKEAWFQMPRWAG
jgi:predicted metal-dependent hydrolase